MAKKVEAYETEDGTVHHSLNAAVAYEVEYLLKDITADTGGSSVNVRVLADQLCHNGAMRLKLKQILEQLG